jgi:hypothetical protein
LTSFFISYNQADKAWAEWIAWSLEEAGHTTVIQAWDFRPGCNFALEMHKAINETERMIAVLSPSYLRSEFTRPEWAAIFGSDPTGELRRLIPVRVQDCSPDGLLKALVWIDLLGLAEGQARMALLDGVAPESTRPVRPRAFPGAQERAVPEQPRFPGVAAAELTSCPTANNAGCPGDGHREPWLIALEELLQIPEVRNAVVVCQVDWDAMCRQIDDLMNYKDLHDQLHQLQFNCYEPIVRTIRSGALDEETRDALSAYEVNLQAIVENLRDIDRRPGSGARGTEWIESLFDAGAELRAAIDCGDADRLRRATGRVRRVLDRQPVRINERIIESARELRLNGVVEALTRVCDRLAQRGIDPERVGELKSGLADLSRLIDDLNATRDNHAQWQEVDVELRLIDIWADRSAENLVGELAESWPHVRRLTDPLCGGSGDDWAVQFRAAGERLDRAIVAQDKGATGLFRTFRHRAGVRFFKVDTDMKRVCEQVRRRGSSLALALRVIQ